ncbi:MAG TPA: AAA family ATPase, partial [Limnochordia bacterium]
AAQARAAELQEREEALLARAAALERSERVEEESVAAAARELERTAAAAAQAEETLRGARARLAAAERAAEAAQRELAALSSQLHAAELARSQAEARLENAGGPLSDAERAELGKAPLPRRGQQELAQALAGVEAELAALGPVNPAAAAEWEAEKARYDDLAAQLQDVREAAERLHRSIRQIDREAALALERTFATVRDAFRRIFRRLFEGGNADLVLTDPAQILASGVEMVAQPPGKRPRSLLALSGGERALVGAALVFAFLEARPAPFCVFDEIDAALDDANLGRFGALVRDVAARTQLILITHRPATMELAGALIGITAAEPGVSQAISLHLDPIDRERTA